MTRNLPLIGLTEEEQAWGARSSEDSRVRRQIGLIVLGTLLLLAVGVWGNWPWLATEHARLEPAQHGLIWAADGTALLWTLWFGVWHGVVGKPASRAELPDTPPLKSATGSRKALANPEGTSRRWRTRASW